MRGEVVGGGSVGRGEEVGGWRGGWKWRGVGGAMITFYYNLFLYTRVVSC